VKRRTSKVVPLKGDFESQQERRWRSADKRVVRWGELQQKDHDFGVWGKDEKLRDAGCAYEFAREWLQFRCWLLLTGRKCEPSGIGTWIEGIRPGLSYLSTSGWVTWLRVFADELAANKSFADVLSADPDKVKKSLAALPSYSLLPKAVELPGRASRRDSVSLRFHLPVFLAARALRLGESCQPVFSFLRLSLCSCSVASKIESEHLAIQDS